MYIIHTQNTTQTGTPVIQLYRSAELLGTFEQILKTKLFVIVYSEREHSA